MAASTPGMFDDIPVIDLEPLQDGAAAGLRRVADAIREAYSQVGFAYLINHGVAQAMIEALFEASRQFHALPRADKMAIEINSFHRGFIPLNTSTVKTSSVAKVTRPNQSESFMMMHDLPDDDPDVAAGAPLAGPNQWPQRLPSFRPAVMAYNDALAALGRKLVRAISVALGGGPDDLDTYFERPTTFLRLLSYPEQPPQTPEEVFGSAPHTDYGFITILAQDDAGGLQVRNVAGEWIDAPYRPGTFVMNSADILHRWSNGRFISTPHRVINRSGRTRYSNPFFFDPNIHAAIAPLPSCVSAARPAAYPPVVFGDYLMARLRKNYNQHQQREAAV